MPHSVEPIETRRLGAWTLRFFHMRDHDRSPLGILAELSNQGTLRGRLTSSVLKDEKSTIDRLNSRAIDWIFEYEKRAHTGNTGFGEL